MTVSFLRGPSRRRTSRWGGRGLALLVSLTVSTLAGGALAQPEKSEQQIEVFKRARKPVEPTAAPSASGPRLRGEDVVRVFQAQAQAKRDEAIRTLESIIRATSADDPQLADYLFRLSEQYWNKAHFFQLRAYGYDDEIWATEQTDPGRHDQLKRLKQEDLARSQQYREKTIEIYKEIIRRFPTYQKLDHVLFYLGFNYKEKGDREAAQKILTMLIKKYPSSQFIPDSLLAFGEFFFEIDQIEPALRFYEKASKYTDSKVYGFALYKMGWCYLNLQKYKKAMEKFLQVIRYSDSKASTKDRNRINLKREAQADLVRAYSHVGSGAKAIAFFKTVAPRDYMKLTKRLAGIYSAGGQVEESTALYRKLIKEAPEDPEIVAYQYAITQNIERQGNKMATTREVKRLVKLYRYMQERGKLTDRKYVQLGNDIQDLLRDLGTTWHREAQVTKNDEYLKFAHVMYKEYVETFPKAKDIYLMTFYYAELLYRVKRWGDAAAAYEKVLELDPKGRFAKEAAHATVLAYQKLLKVGERSESRASPAQRAGEEGMGKVPPPKEIAGDQKRFLAACDRYAAIVPDGDRIVDVKYYVALTYYDHNQFKEAIRRFEDIIQHHASHRLATFAANLVLDSYNLMQDYDGLNAAVERFSRNKHIAKGEFLEMLMTLREGAAFKACLKAESEKRYKDAAAAFMKFASEFPTSEHFDKALYNAALNYERANDIGNAIKARLKLIQMRPDSPLVPKALFAIAGNFHASAIYSQAAKSYEFYAASYPGTKKAEIALANAAVFRQGLGQHDKAIEDYRSWMKQYGKKKPSKAASVQLTIAQIYTEQEQYNRAVRELRIFLRTWARHATDDELVMAYTRLALVYKKQGRDRDAAKTFAKAVKTFNGFPAGRQKALTDGREAAAHARYEQAEALYADFAALKIRSAKKLTKQVVEKVKAMAKAQDVYATVIDYGHPNWTIAAMGRIGQGWQDLADAIRKAPPPKGLNEEELLVYQDELDQKALQFEEKAVTFYAKCLELAAKFKWFNEYTVRAETNLGKLDPQRFQPISEIRSKPSRVGQRVQSAGFDTEVQ